MASQNDLAKQKAPAPDPQQAAQDQRDKQQQLTLLGKQVLGVLGQPADLFRVQVRRLWDNHYRVNVLVGDDPTAVAFAHSYFLVTDEAGGIVETTPQLLRAY